MSLKKPEQSHLFQVNYYIINEKVFITVSVAMRRFFYHKQNFILAVVGQVFINRVNDQAVSYVDDFSHGMQRIEVRCRHCNAHLGHVLPMAPNRLGNVIVLILLH